jgi:exopolysaccharide production protein ExoY
MTSVLGGRRRSAAFVPERAVPVPEALTGLFGETKKIIATATGGLRRVGAQQPLGGVSKRCMDIILSVAILVALSPIMLVVAALIRVRLGGPVIFAQPRIGFGGSVFTCYKFRSMPNNAAELLERHLAANPDAAEEWKKTRKLLIDPRVGCLGNILRKSSLDELPQLFNVVLGDMSLVGPRPVVPDELANYGRYARDYCLTRPGITGLWQTTGRNRVSYRGRVARDRFYVRNWSLRMDLALLLKTVRTVMSFDQTA